MVLGVRNRTAQGLLSTEDKDKLAGVVGGLDRMPGPAPTADSLNPWSGVGKVDPTQALPEVPQGPAPALKSFTFNPKYAQLDQANTRRLTDAQLAKQQREQDINEDYGTATSLADKQKQEAMTRLRDSMIARGLLGSSITTEETGKIGEGYQNYLSQLAQQRARGLRDTNTDYAGNINNINSLREQMYVSQTEEEEAARLQKIKDDEESAARLRAEQEIKALRDAIPPTPPPAPYVPPPPPAPPPMPTWTGGGGYEEEEAYQEPAPAPAPQQDMVALPPFGNGVSLGAVQNWVRENVDPWVSGQAMNKVIEVLSQAGPTGVPRSDIGWLIQHYSRPKVSSSRPNSGSVIRRR